MRSPAAALLVIDCSVEQWADVPWRRPSTQAAIARLVADDNGRFAIKCDCRLWIGNDAETTSLWTVYPGVGRAHTAGAALLPDLQAVAGGGGMTFVPKVHYSAFFESALDDVLRAHAITDVYLAGINTDFCVFDTALDAFARRYRTFIVEDACSSVGGADGHRIGLRQAVNHFGKQAVVSVEQLIH
jgi:nicotinamidase-related amidase